MYAGNINRVYKPPSSPSHLNLSVQPPTAVAAILPLRPPTQRIDDLLILQPTLGHRPPISPIRLLPLQSLHGAEDDTRALDADDGHRQVVGCDLVLGHAGVFFDGLDAFDGETDGTHAVHGRGRAALLDVAGDSEAGFEAAFGFFLDHVGDDLGGVCGVGVFVVQYQFPRATLAFVFGEAGFQMVDVAGQHFHGYAFFGRVDR